MKAVQFADRN